MREVPCIAYIGLHSYIASQLTLLQLYICTYIQYIIYVAMLCICMYVLAIYNSQLQPMTQLLQLHSYIIYTIILYINRQIDNYSYSYSFCSRISPYSVNKTKGQNITSEFNQLILRFVPAMSVTEIQASNRFSTAFSRFGCAVSCLLQTSEDSTKCEQSSRNLYCQY